MTSLSGSIKSIEIVLDLAIHLEKTGKAFYEEVRAAVSDEKLKSLLLLLISQEAAHMEQYGRLVRQATGQPAYQDTLFGEYGMYIDLLVEEVTGRLRFAASLSPREVIDMAVAFEKDTLLFYNEIKMLFDGQDRETVAKICREEKKHIEMLLTFKKAASLE